MRNITILIIFIFTIFQSSYGLQCIRSQCRGCPIDKIEETVESEKCEPESNRQNSEFSCIKIVASDPFSENVDVVRSCIETREGHDMCKNINEKSQGISKCQLCATDFCNKAQTTTATSTLMIFLICIYLII